MNIGIITVGEKKYSFSFTWGDIVSPFGKDSDAWLKSAGGFAIGQSFLKDTSRNLLNNFFKSGEFKQLITDIMESAVNDDSGSDAEDKSKEEIAKKEDLVVVCMAAPTALPGSTNLVMVHHVGESDLS